MNKLHDTGVYYTQAEDMPIDRRVFIKKAAGMNATSEKFREATQEELDAYAAYVDELTNKERVYGR